ncbi:hypothetical protein [Carboxylicivirga taeanensis]|uniref:hypothetical protein n=1 Tax=Carboxylicivirga taeanensis TaxID=1416875 RepID=UPI003F6DB7DF
MVVDVLLNGEMIFENLDLYNKELALKERFFKNGSINKGKNILKIIAKGTNPSSVNADKMGLDYLMVSMN